MSRFRVRLSIAVPDRRFVRFRSFCRRRREFSRPLRPGLRRCGRTPVRRESCRPRRRRRLGGFWVDQSMPAKISNCVVAFLRRRKGRRRRSPISVLALKGAATQLGVVATADRSAGPLRTLKGAASTGLRPISRPSAGSGGARDHRRVRWGLQPSLRAGARSATGRSEGWTGCRRLKADADALLAVRCCFENHRRSEIIGRRDFCSAAA